MKIVNIKTISHAILIAITISSAHAEELCNKDFFALYDSDKYSDINSKITQWQSLSDKCSGTGLYESRLSLLYFEAGDYNKAESIIKSGLQLNSKYEKELLFGLADIKFQQEDSDAAQKIAYEIIEKHKDWFGGYSMLGQIQTAIHDFKGAVESYEKSNSIEEKANTYSLLAINYHYIEDHENAIASMQKAIKLDQNELKQRLAVPATAYSLMSLGYIEEAKDLLVQHQSVRPESKDDPVFVKAALYLQKKIDENKK